MIYIPIEGPSKFYPAGNLPELDLHDCTLSTIVRYIYSGELEDVQRVLQVDETTGRCADVVRQVAEMVVDLCEVEQREPHLDLRNWLQEQLGFKRYSPVVDLRAVCEERADRRWQERREMKLTER